jgi:hypothetical protein
MFTPNRNATERMRKEWIRRLNDIRKTPDGEKWFKLYSIYYNHIANKDFIKKIYTGDIQDSNIPQFMAKLTRRFENVEKVKPNENFIKLKRRISPNNVYEIRNKWRKKGAPISRPTVFSKNKGLERRNYTTQYPPGWIKILPHSKITARNIVRQTRPPPLPVKKSRVDAWIRLFDPRGDILKNLRALSYR